MKKSLLLTLAVAFTLSLTGFGQGNSKLVSTKTQVKFFSSTAAEDIEAFNTASKSTIDKSTGEVVFSVPMQGFEFDKSLMQKHYNSKKFLDTKNYPESKLKGKITNIESIDFSKDGSYPATVEGDLTIKGVTNSITEKGTVTVKGAVVKVESKFNVTRSDYEITLPDGKPSNNVAKTLEITVQAEYK